MKKTLTALTAAVALAAALSVAPTDAFAQRRGGAVAAGVLGGLAVGAIIGGAIATSPAYVAPAPYPAYVPVQGYVPYAGYAAPYPVACPGGYWARQPIVNPYGQVVAYSRPRFFCP